MRVIRINAVYGVSSTGRTAKQLDEGLKRYGVDSTTVYSSGPSSERGYSMGSKAGVRLHSLLARVFGDAGYHSAFSTWKLIKYLDAEKPDIVHLHNLHGNYISVPKLFKYLAEREIPVVVTLHDCWWYTGKCCHYTLDGCYKWQQSCGNCPRLKKDIPSFFFDRTKRMLSDRKSFFASLKKYAVIGVSDWITGEAEKSFLKNAAVIRRIYNWIDTDRFRPVDSNVREEYGIGERFLILSVAAKWSDAKGLKALAALSERLDENACLVLIGAVPEGADTGRAMIVPPTESQEKLAEWYSAADVFISLSLEESFGKVCAEALSCGTPVIAVDSTASPELVGEGCGVVVNGTGADEVLSAVASVRTAGKESFTDRCRAFALSNFDMENNIKATFELYKELLDKE